MEQVPENLEELHELRLYCTNIKQVVREQELVIQKTKEKIELLESLQIQISFKNFYKF